MAGAAHGKGRGREVIAVAKSSDLVMMVLDASKEEGNNHRCGAVAASLLPCAVCVGLREGCYVLLGGGVAVCGVDLTPTLAPFRTPSPRSRPRFCRQGHQNN